MDLERKVGKELTKHIDREYIDKFPSSYGVICFVSENYFYLYNPATKEFVSLVEGLSSPYNDHRVLVITLGVKFLLCQLVMKLVLVLRK